MMRAEQSRAEQSRAEQSRAEQIDIIKAICAFFVICIHAPFPGENGAYFTALTRVAVPIFFMITGYFYSNTVAKHKEKQQIKKIFFLMLKANLLFLIWNLTLILSQKGDLRSYLKAIFTGKNLERFLLLNESPFAGHLWYLGAILYVLLIVSLTDAFQCRKIVYYLTPVLLAADLLFGKYSLLVLGREYPYIFVRNFLCVGIPYFCIGNLIKEKR